MSEKWAVAIQPNGEGQGRFHWVRNETGEIAVFPSQRKARLWMLTGSQTDQGVEDIVYIRIKKYENP